MFPTRSKFKIPRSLCYALKAKAISEALADVPQADELELSFYSDLTPAELRRRTEFRLIKISYSYSEVDQFTSYDMEKWGYNDPKWEITVYAVPVEIRARATQLLHDEALPKLATWLHSKSELNNVNSCSVEIIYDEPADHLKNIKRET